MPVLLEVTVDSVASAIAAEHGGAHRIELCGSLADGGITPSAGLIAMVRKRIALPVHVLVRPRTGDFCYTSDEFEVIKRDILLARQLGANGVALGILAPDRRIDVSRTRELVDLAGPLSVTFHRAFDATPGLPAALEEVVSTGADRILTAGGAATAEEGTAMIARLVAVAGSRITLLACGRIREHNVASLLKATAVKEVHANLQTLVSLSDGAAETNATSALFGTSSRGEVLHATVERFLKAAAEVP